MGTNDKLWTREEVCTRILAGETLFIYNGKLIRVPPSWLAKHPGGRLAILHFVGRDATDEVNAFHPEAALKQLNRYSIGRVAVGPNGWEPLVPPVMTGWVRQKGESGEETWEREAEAWNVDAVGEHGPLPTSEILLVKKADVDQRQETKPTMSSITPPPTTLSLKTQQQHMKAYRALHAEITNAGLYKTPYLTGYGPEVARYTLMAIVSVLAYRYGWFMTSAVFLGFLFHQLTFTVHDLGHNGVTHIWAVDRAISILISDFTGGLSTGWWVDNHNIHHLVTNHPSHDPDIQHLPFFAISPKFLSSLWSSYYKRVMAHDAFSKVFLSLQHKLFYVVMSLARFNLYANSYGFLIKSGLQGRRGWTWWLEITGIAFYWTWYTAVLRGCGDWKTALGFFLISHVVPSPLHVQIVLSHFSRSTEDLGPTESFLARQLRTTTDVICPPHLAFFHGGLHLQVTHHLFPRLPRHNLGAASQIVKRFAAEQGLEYAEFGFVAGNREVIGVLADVASQVGVVGMVARSEVEKAIKG